jgi:hypothetical protein
MSKVSKIPLNEDTFDDEDRETQIQDNIEADLSHNDFSEKNFQYQIPVGFVGNIIDEDVEYTMVENSARFEEPTKFAISYMTNAKGYNITISLILDVNIKDKFDGQKFVFYTVNSIDPHDINVTFSK